MAMNIPATTDADKAYAMKAAEFRSMPNDQQGMARLQQATRGPFGALALIEIDKRTRAELLDAVQKQNANQQDQNMLQQALQRQAQAQMMNRLADDERMGLNNIVAQAEQGALQFGEPAPEGLAGGGIIAFQDGGRTPIGRWWEGIKQDYFTMTPQQKILKELEEANKPAGGLFGEESDEQYRARQAKVKSLQDEYKRLGAQGPMDSLSTLREKAAATRNTGVTAEMRNIADTAQSRMQNILAGRSPIDERAAASSNKTGIASLNAPDIETDPRKIIETETALLKEMGLGAYGDKAKESMGKRRGEAKERAEKRLGSETFLAAAEAAGGGGKRMSGLQALAAAVSGAGKTAATIGRERDAALDKIAEGEEKLLLAQDLYERGRVGDALKLSREGKKDKFDNQVKLKTLDLTQQKLNAYIEAAKSKAGGSFKQDIARLNTAIQDTMAKIETTKNPQDLAILRQQLQLLRAAQTRALMSGVSTTDEPD